jgi:drug/metabolite transporter (DMT)-like permease
MWAPLRSRRSIVQAVLYDGLVFLVVLAKRYFGLRLGRRQWAGVNVTAFGLAVIAVGWGAHQRGESVTRWHR